MRALVTGAAGFIGFHLSDSLLKDGWQVLGYDSINEYYDQKFKYSRLDVLNQHKNFSVVKGLLEDKEKLSFHWKAFKPNVVINLAAQAGVRYSLENPMAYIQANIVGFQNVIDLAREIGVDNLVYASSSSVYGAIKELPFHEKQNINNPISLYAATKASNELVAKTYSHLFGIATVGLRFFTVYGPYGRPDMALFKFAKAIMAGDPIQLYNEGRMVRDFTYIDDIIQGIRSCMAKPQLGEVYNLGKGQPENLMEMVSILERSLGKKARFEMLPMQLGDVAATHADITKAQRDFDYQPKTSIREGIPRFAEWFVNMVAKNS